MLFVEARQIAQLHLAVEGFVLTRVGLGDGTQQLADLAVYGLTTLLGLRGVDVALALEPLVEDMLVEALLVQHEVEVGEEIIHAVGLATCLHPVHVLRDGEVDLHRAGAQPFGELIAVVLVEARGHDEALHGGEGGEVCGLHDGLPALGGGEEEDFPLEFLRQILVEDLHAIGEGPLGSPERGDLLLLSDAPCGKLEVDELRDGLRSFRFEDGPLISGERLTEVLLGDRISLWTIGIGDEGEVAITHRTLFEPSA